MRARKEIMENAYQWQAKTTPDCLKLEVLLDIRDLLINQKNTMENKTK
jgi:hypothetical protein